MKKSKSKNKLMRIGLRNILLCSPEHFATFDIASFAHGLYKINGIKYDNKPIQMQYDTFCPFNRAYFFDSAGKMFKIVLKNGASK